jgi:transcriptional regulator with XRE-family HTH domain
VGTDVAAEIGHVLRQVRRSRGLTLRDVALRSRGALKATSIAGYERGERSVSLGRFLVLARFYDVPPARLVGEIVRRIEGLPPVTVDLAALERLGSTEGMLVADFGNEVRALRNEAPGPTLTLRSGDLEVLAMASGARPEEFTAEIAPALSRPERRTRP